LLGAFVPILPEHIWATVPFATAATGFQSAPPVVGTGPFQIVDWQHGTSARFVRNPDYWGQRPFLDEVRFRFYPDRTALAAALERGDIDYARGIAPADVDDLDSEADIVTVEGSATGSRTSPTTRMRRRSTAGARRPPRSETPSSAMPWDTRSIATRSSMRPSTATRRREPR